MANTLLNVDKITNAALAILHQKLNFVGSINRTYDSSFAVEGAKIGSTLRIRLPNKFTTTTGQALNLQDVQETNTTLTVATQRGVHTVFNSQQLALNIFDFSQQVLEPAMAQLAASIEIPEVHNPARLPQQTPPTAPAAPPNARPETATEDSERSKTHCLSCHSASRIRADRAPGSANRPQWQSSPTVHFLPNTATLRTGLSPTRYKSNT